MRYSVGALIQGLSVDASGVGAPVIWLAFHARLTGGCVTPRNLPDDIALVTISISDATLCADCIAKKTGIPLARVEPLLIRIASTLRVLSAAALCDACLTAKRVFRLA